MSGNSCLSALQTAPIVTAFWRGRSCCCSTSSGGSAGSSGSSTLGLRVLGLAIRRRPSAVQECELEFADLELVPVAQPMGLDPAPVHIGAIQRAEVVQVVILAAAHQDRVVAGNRHVVEENVGLRPAADREPVPA